MAADINQGELGNCYFLSCLMSLIEHPSRIRSLIRATQVNDAGIYEVVFHVNGSNTASIVVDDYFPVHPNSKTLAFCTPKPNKNKNNQVAIWAMLVEKAWAKTHGSFARIEGGLTCNAWAHLVGVPSESIYHETVKEKKVTEAELWANLRACYEQRFSMCAGSNEQAEENISDGLRGSHSYTVLSLH